MTPQELTNILMGVIIATIGYIGQVLIKKIERFEIIIQKILLKDVSNTKDIERLVSDVDNHEKRITKLEN